MGWGSNPAMVKNTSFIFISWVLFLNTTQPQRMQNGPQRQTPGRAFPAILPISRIIMKVHSISLTQGHIFEPKPFWKLKRPHTLSKHIFLKWPVEPRNNLRFHDRQKESSSRALGPGMVSMALFSKHTCCKESPTEGTKDSDFSGPLLVCS